MGGFGLLALRLDDFEATQVDKVCYLRGQVARRLEPPLLSEDVVQVVKKGWRPRSLLEQLDHDMALPLGGR